MNCSLPRYIDTALRASPYAITPIVAQVVSSKEFNEFVCDEDLLNALNRQVCKTKTISEIIARLASVIRDGEFLMYDGIYCKRTHHTIQSFVTSDISIGKGATATIFLCQRFLINRNQNRFKLIKHTEALFSLMTINKDNFHRAASRVQAAESFKDCQYLVRTYAWCFHPQWVNVGNHTIRITNLMIFMRQYPMDLLTYICSPHVSSERGFADRTDLRTLHSPVSLNSRVRILHDVAKGLQEIQGFIHRDIKPENLLLSVDPRTNEILKVRIADFDLMTSLNLSDARFKNPAGSTDWRPPETLSIVYAPKMIRAELVVHATTPKIDYNALGLVVKAVELGAYPDFRFLIRWWCDKEIPKQGTEGCQWHAKWLDIKQKQKANPLPANPTYNDIMEGLLSSNPTLRPNAEQILAFVERSGLLVSHKKNQHIRRNSIT